MALKICYANLPKRQRLAVMHPFVLPAGASGPSTSAWLASLPPWTLLVLASPLLLWPGYAMAATNFSMLDAFATLQRWIPFLLKSGFLFNIIISLFAMLFGTVAGAALGLAQISQVNTISRLAWFITQLFRNSPWLVILFIVLLAFPFEVVIFDTVIRIPDWMKAVFGLSLPVMAK